MPRSRLGRLACWFGAVFVAWWVLNLGIVQLVQRIDAQDYRTVLIAFSWLGLSTGFVASILATIALVRHKDRTVLVWLCLIPGAFLVVFLLGEFLLPH